jgi:predicted GNAT family N-acyltransferase
MNLIIKVYDSLPEDAKKIRTTVFVDEQHFVDEFDESDDKAIHIVMFDDNVAIGTSRIIYSDKHNCLSVGRFAIIKSYRGKHLGEKLMKVTEQEILKRFGETEVGVSSQERAAKVYEKQGYRYSGERYFDQHCPHVWMIKKLNY